MESGGEAIAGGALTYRGLVYPWHCDHIGHMNVMWYVGKFDEATWNLFATLGITRAYLAENDRGMAAVRQDLTYKRELLAGDVITVYSRIIEMRAKVIRFVHEMRLGEAGEIAALADCTGVHLDAGARKACPFPDHILARGGAMIGKARVPS